LNAINLGIPAVRLYFDFYQIFCSSFEDAAENKENKVVFYHNFSILSYNHLVLMPIFNKITKL
jgi:hypothetical protein